MSKKLELPMAQNDFYKSNGVDTRFKCEGPSLTRQEFAEECDINTIMKKYDGHIDTGPGGLPNTRDPATRFYADFTVLPSTLMEYHEYVRQADEAFMTLPAMVRKEFDNDPYQFVAYAADENNLEQMRKWGLAPPAKPDVEPPMRVEVVNPSSPPNGGSGGQASS